MKILSENRIKCDYHKQPNEFSAIKVSPRLQFINYTSHIQATELLK